MADDGEDLESICSNNGVPAHIFSGMLTAGWTIATLPTRFKDASEFDDESALQDLGITEASTSSTSEGGWHEAFPRKLGHSTVVDMKNYLDCKYLHQCAFPRSDPSIQRRNTFRFPTDNYPTKTMVSQSQIQTR